MIFEFHSKIILVLMKLIKTVNTIAILLLFLTLKRRGARETERGIINFLIKSASIIVIASETWLTSRRNPRQEEAERSYLPSRRNEQVHKVQLNLKSVYLTKLLRNLSFFRCRRSSSRSCRCCFRGRSSSTGRSVGSR